MSKENKPENKQPSTAPETKATVERVTPMLTYSFYEEDVKALGFENVSRGDSKLNKEVREKIRTKLGLPVRTRNSVQTQLKEKLGLEANAKPSEVMKACKKAVIEGKL